MRTIFPALIAVIALALAPARSWATDAPQFAVGQEWTVKNSPIHIVIGRVEQVGKITVVSVSLFQIPCPTGFGCTIIGAAHMPFEELALANSVDTLVSTNGQTAPEFEAGYENWKEAHGGAFTISVPEEDRL